MCCRRGRLAGIGLNGGVLTVRRDDGFLLSDDRDRIDLDRVHRWLSTDAWWALDRTHDQMHDIVAASRPYGVYRDDEQVAFTQVVTDGVVFAYVADVYVDLAWRGQGLAIWMIREICARLDALGVHSTALATTDAHDLYAKAGFEDVPPRRWMSRRHPGRAKRHR